MEKVTVKTMDGKEKEMKCRRTFWNVLAMNSTPETAREMPEKKIVDIDNWAW